MRQLNNEKMFFDIVNSHVTDSLPKFRTPNEIKIFPHGKKYELSQKASLCVVYTLWENLVYLKLSYISLISQLKFTDIVDYDVRFYVHKNIYVHAVKILGTLIDKEKIVSVDNFDYMRYYLCNELQEEFETVIFCDADAYILGSPQNFLYRGLKKLSDEKKSRIISKAPFARLDYTIEDRRVGRIARIAADIKEMTEFLSRVTKTNTDSLKGIGRWPLGGFHVIGNHQFREDRSDFLMWAKVFREIDFPCDETFWKLWAEKYSYEFFDLEENGMIRWELELTHEDYYVNGKMWATDGTNHFFHPFTGTECYHPQLLPFFEWLQL